MVVTTFAETKENESVPLTTQSNVIFPSAIFDLDIYTTPTLADLPNAATAVASTTLSKLFLHSLMSTSSSVVDKLVASLSPSVDIGGDGCISDGSSDSLSDSASDSASGSDFCCNSGEDFLLPPDGRAQEIAAVVLLEGGGIRSLTVFFRGCFAA
eukprot:15360924-Ditylum_brightwellii.AAC.2